MAAVGLIVAAYITYLDYSGSEAAFCSAGSGCDVVRNSRYSDVVGVPVALIGALGYLVLMALALVSIEPKFKAISLFTLSLAGFVFSAYLTYLEVFTIDALCPYCLVSFAIIAAILAVQLGVIMRTAGLVNIRIVGMAGVVAALVLLVSVAAHAGGEGEAEEPYAVELARHLTDSGAVMYGAYWCPHCENQKARFGNAFKYVNYVECDPRGKDAKPALCEAKGIKSYPTWEINGQMYSSNRPLSELAALSGFESP